MYPEVLWEIKATLFAVDALDSVSWSLLSLHSISRLPPPLSQSCWPICFVKKQTFFRFHACLWFWRLSDLTESGLRVLSVGLVQIQGQAPPMFSTLSPVQHPSRFHSQNPDFSQCPSRAHLVPLWGVLGNHSADRFAFLPQVQSCLSGKVQAVVFLMWKKFKP